MSLLPKFQEGLEFNYIPNITKVGTARCIDVALLNIKNNIVLADLMFF